MNFNNLLNQVLGSVQKNAGQAGNILSGNKGTLAKIGGSAAALGLVSSLLKKKNTKTLVQAGSMAALGALAYHAYQSWQNNQNTQSAAAPALEQTEFAPAGIAAENASRVILRTMIAAAAADGLIDDAERQLIHSEVGDDAETQQWIASEVTRPASPADIARDIGTNPALAAEAYLAARMVCGDLARKEIVFLSQLSQALNLDEGLVEHLEKQAGF
ncbi:tellurite resistance TerB family protein [Neisseria canis]|uniref:Protein of uncharacterized function (DUF533) n=1 Tax=Neisseria canis TaxID=493 RepID=A0A1X3D0B7_9NEIS|nr:DUF533 domain-containing protein [Neisseria canis]OSI13202.1 hypothetical protein BWD07_01045 [Neisseria canis]VEF01932.1 Protein of uncharacterised function (DUF533) [Neisseria canis]